MMSLCAEHINMPRSQGSYGMIGQICYGYLKVTMSLGIRHSNKYFVFGKCDRIGLPTHPPLLSSARVFSLMFIAYIVSLFHLKLPIGNTQIIHTES